MTMEEIDPRAKTEPPIARSPYNWFPGLSSEVKTALRQITEEVAEKRTKASELAQAWLRKVLSSEKLAESLHYFGLPVPTPGDPPGFENSLAYALASSTVATDEFSAYIAEMGYRYWKNDGERSDIIRVSGQLWSLSTGVSSPLLEEWYRHILKNVSDPMQQKVSPTVRTAQNPNIEWPVLQQIASDRIAVSHITHLATLGGALYTGPRFATIVVALRGDGYFGRLR